MKNKFAIIGGDLRIIKLTEMLADEENENLADKNNVYKLKY